MKILSETVLSLIEAKTFPHDIKPELVRCCPTMDLVAYVSLDERVEVFRFGGQRAFVCHRKESNIQVLSLCWKYNGQYLAVSWSDGLVDVISSETGSPLQIFRQVTNFTDTNPADSGISIMCTGWGLSLVDYATFKGKVATSIIDSSPIQGPLSTNEVDINVDDLLDREPDIDIIGIPADLSNQLLQLDVTDVMPKLPILSMPASSTFRTTQPSLAELFSSQALLDAALHKDSSRELYALNTLLLSNQEGAIRVIVYDSLSIGNISLPFAHPARHIKHASHPLAHCHVLLSQYEAGPTQFQTALLPISFRFLRSAGRNIHFIDSKTAQLELLVQYVGEALIAIEHHWKHAQDLPSRFQQSISETLREKEEPSLSQSLYQLAVTGYCSETLKEWLTDQLAERGHKRWDHSVTQGYIKVLELLQENLLPGLDRCTVVLSTLQGLAQHHEHSTAFDIPLLSFSIIVDIVRCIRLLAHRMLLLASEEYHHFLAFSKWLRHAIDVQSADPTSTVGDEIIERDPGVDYLSALSYIRHGLERSRINQFLSDPGPSSPNIKANPNMYDDLREALKSSNEAKATKGDLLKISSYYTQCRIHNKSLVEQITSWQRKTTIVPGGLVLADGELSRYDVRMVSEGLDQTSITTYVAITKEVSSHYAYIYRILHTRLFDEVSDNALSCEATKIHAHDGEILDVKFIDDSEMIILLKTESDFHLITVPYRQFEEKASVLHFRPVQISSSILPNGVEPQVESEWILPMAEELNQYRLHQFDLDSGDFHPARIEVNGRTNRQSCILIAEDHRQVRIYDIGNRKNIGGS